MESNEKSLVKNSNGPFSDWRIQTGKSDPAPNVPRANVQGLIDYTIDPSTSGRPLGAPAYIVPGQAFTPVGSALSKLLVPFNEDKVPTFSGGDDRALDNFAKQLTQAGLSSRGQKDIADWYSNYRNSLSSKSPKIQASELVKARDAVAKNLRNRYIHEMKWRQSRAGQLADLIGAGLLAGGAYGLYRAIPKIKEMRERKKQLEKERESGISEASSDDSSEKKASKVVRDYDVYRSNTPITTANEPWTNVFSIDKISPSMYTAAATLPFVLGTYGMDKLTNLYRRKKLDKERAEVIREFQELLSNSPVVATDVKQAGVLNIVGVMEDAYIKSAADEKENWVATLAQTAPGVLLTLGGLSLIGGASLGRRMALKTDPNLKKKTALEIALRRRRMNAPVRLEIVEADPSQTPALPEYRGGKYEPASRYRVPVILPEDSDKSKKRSRSSDIYADAMDLTKISNSIAAHALLKMSQVGQSASPGPTSGAQKEPNFLDKAKDLFGRIETVADNLGDAARTANDPKTQLGETIQNANRLVQNLGGTGGLTQKIEDTRQKVTKLHDVAVPFMQGVQPVLDFGKTMGSLVSTSFGGIGKMISDGFKAFGAGGQSSAGQTGAVANNPAGN